jgi:hypothetical protein
MSGLLHKNGIVMGREEKKEFYPAPTKENPIGFYENIRFRRINDTLLKMCNYRVKSFSSEIPIMPKLKNHKIVVKMMKMIEEYNSEFKNWGWKDPRTSLTLSIWLDVLNKMDLVDKVKVIIMRRDLEKIAESMRARGNKERFEGQFVHLATNHYNRSHYYISSCDYGVRPLELHFEDVLRQPRFTAKRLTEYLVYPIRDYSHIDPKISKH